MDATLKLRVAVQAGTRPVFSETKLGRAYINYFFDMSFLDIPASLDLRRVLPEFELCESGPVQEYTVRGTMRDCLELLDKLSDEKVLQKRKDLDAKIVLMKFGEADRILAGDIRAEVSVKLGKRAGSYTVSKPLWLTDGQLQFKLQRAVLKGAVLKLLPEFLFEGSSWGHLYLTGHARCTALRKIGITKRR